MAWGIVMDQETLFKLLAAFDASSVKEMAVDFEGAHVYLNKNDIARKEPQVTAPTKATATMDETPISAVAKSAPEQPSAETAPETTANDVVKAQMVGVVYLQPAPEKDNYVHVGDHVKKGQTVCVIEAMKMLTEVKSEFTGVIVSINVNNEEMVDYDQPLMTIQTD